MKPAKTFNALQAAYTSYTLPQAGSLRFLVNAVFAPNPNCFLLRLSPTLSTHLTVLRYAYWFISVPPSLSVNLRCRSLDLSFTAPSESATNHDTLTRLAPLPLCGTLAPNVRAVEPAARSSISADARYQDFCRPARSSCPPRGDGPSFRMRRRASPFARAMQMFALSCALRFLLAQQLPVRRATSRAGRARRVHVHRRCRLLAGPVRPSALSQCPWDSPSQVVASFTVRDEARRVKSARGCRPQRQLSCRDFTPKRGRRAASQTWWTSLVSPAKTPGGCSARRTV